MTVLHRNRFVAYQPFLNAHVAVSARSGLLAVAREHSIVDIFSMSTNFAHFRRLVALPAGLSIESLCFVAFADSPPGQLDLAFNPKQDTVLSKPPSCYDLLAVASIDGLVRIVSPRTARMMCSCESNGGGAVWSVCALGGGRLAAGYHDGSVRLLALSSDGLSLEHRGVLDRSPEGRVHRLAFCPRTNLLAAAMDNGSVRIVDVAHSKPVGQFQTAGVVPTAVEWSENGDSLFVGLLTGKLLIVDPMICQPRAEMSHHVAAIQSIVSCGPGHVFVSGVDHRTLHVSRESPQSARWLRSGQRRVCHNDVVGMAYAVVAGRPMLIQGCRDGSLRVVNPFNFDAPANDRCISGLPVRPIVRTTRTHLVADLGQKVSLWTHGALGPDGERMLAEPELVATVNFGEPVIALDMAGNRLAVQLSRRVVLYNIVGGQPLVKDRSFGSSADLICFGPPSAGHCLYSCEQDAKGCRVRCDRQDLAFIETHSFAIRMACGADGLSIAFSDSLVCTVDLKSKRVRRIEFDHPVIAMSYNQQSRLVCYTANHECFTVGKGQTRTAMPHHWTHRQDAVQGVTGNGLFVWSEAGVCRLGRSDDESVQLRADGSEDHRPLQSVIHFDFVADDEAVVVERPWRDIMSGLPPTTEVPKYGQQ